MATKKRDDTQTVAVSADSVRAILDVFEAGTLNSAQKRAVHNVRVSIGDAEGLGCAHENVAYEEGDVLVCQDCREVITPEA